jgi:hypothetical protein
LFFYIFLIIKSYLLLQIQAAPKTKYAFNSIPARLVAAHVFKGTAAKVNQLGHQAALYTDVSL